MPASNADAILLQRLGVDVVDVDPRPRVDAGMDQRFRKRLVRLGQVDVLADHRDVDVLLRMLQRVDELLPRREVGRWRIDRELLADDHVKPFRVQRRGDLVDRIGVERRDDRLGRDVGEQRDLAAVAVRDRAVGAAQHDVRLDADFAQFLHRVLRRLGLHLAGCRDVRHQRQMDVADVVAAERDADLPDRLEERQRLDVADGAADFDDRDFGISVDRRPPGSTP